MTKAFSSGASILISVLLPGALENGLQRRRTTTPNVIYLIYVVDILPNNLALDIISSNIEALLGTAHDTSDAN